jgi:hypothetical protein
MVDMWNTRYLGDITMPRGIKTVPKTRLPRRLHLEIPAGRQDLVRAVQMRALRKGMPAKQVAAEGLEEAFAFELEQIEK